MSDRHLWIATIGIAGLILAKVALNFVVNPLNGERHALERALAAVSDQGTLDGENDDPEGWAQSIEGAPALWQEIVEPGPVVAPPPPKLEAPDMLAMLKTLRVGKAQIGTSKIKIFTPEAPRGTWLEVGESFNGCTLASFDRENAVFTYYWEAGKRKLELILARE